jgi:Tfp pilus assembly protein PilN
MPEINLIPTEYKKKRIGLGAVFSKAVGIGLVLLVLSLLVYGGLLIYKKTLTQKISGLTQNISDLESKRDSKLENSVYKADKKLTAVENLFKDHLYWSKIFAKIESSVVPEAYFLTAETTIANDKVSLTLSGNSKSYTGLAKQIISFKKDALVEKIELSDIKLSEAGGIDFTLIISLNKSVLVNKTE